VSSYGNDFNFDYHVSFTSEQIAEGRAYYNYELRPNTLSDQVGISVFCKNESGEVFHTYSCYARGVDMLNAPTTTSTSRRRAAMRTASNTRWSGYAGTISIERALRSMRRGDHRPPAHVWRRDQGADRNPATLVSPAVRPIHGTDYLTTTNREVVSGTERTTKGSQAAKGEYR
jgi:hypothetical protein